MKLEFSNLELTNTKADADFASVVLGGTLVYTWSEVYELATRGGFAKQVAIFIHNAADRQAHAEREADQRERRENRNWSLRQ